MDILRMDLYGNRHCALRLVVVIVLALGFLTALLLVLRPPSQAASATVSVGLLPDLAGINDQGFNWMSYQGLLRAVDELDVSGTVYTPTISVPYTPTLQKCVDDGNDLCITVGFAWADATLAAAETYTGTSFAIVDVTWESCPDNLRGMAFASDEVGYLAGTVAGMMTESDLIGAIGGMSIPPVNDFIYGYRNGAQCANVNVNTVISYANNFDNPAIGAEIAQGMIDQGVDVIFGVGGPMGAGAVLTTTQSGAWGIGVDMDYYYTVFDGGAVPGSEWLLTSAMKRIDKAVFGTIGDVVSGTFTSGTVLYDLATDGVGLAPFHDADGAVPQAVRDRLQAVTQDIIGGTIDVDHPCGAFVYLPLVVSTYP
jgi:basic membrane protein A and related proteins